MLDRRITLLLSLSTCVIAACGNDGGKADPTTTSTDDSDTSVDPDSTQSDTSDPEVSDPDTQTCTPGSKGCSCNDGDCQGLLICRDDLCVEATGLVGGPCNDDGTCESGAKCDGGLCTLCYVGSNGCDCKDDGSCISGLECDVSIDRCVPEGTAIATIPAQPKCYTRCTQGFLDGSTWRECESGGIMAGCVGDRSCSDGSCLLAGEDVPSCASDVDCPDHQACMHQKCYSNCESDDDCGGGAECYLKVCRVPCTTATTCAEGTACDIVSNGSTGYCMPSAIVSDVTPSTTAIDGGFSVSPLSFDLSNTQTAVTFTITNDTESIVTFRVRKLEHTLYEADGSSASLSDYDDGVDCDPASTCPLYWLDMGESGQDLERTDEIEVTVDPMGSIDVAIENGGGVDATSYSGTLEVISNLGKASVNLVYAEKADGQWKGTAYYYASWNDTGLSAWSESPTTRANDAKQNLLKNAFVQRWVAFRSNRSLPWDEMRAVMTATQTGSWEDASELDDCNFPLCYYYDGSASGVAGYSSDATNSPVPTGVTELPFAMNLKQDPSDETKLSGRIESTGTLHYAGNPAVTVELARPHDECDFTDADGACVTLIDSFAATISVGGRWLTTESDTTCSKRAGQGFEQFRTPWLLPGFARATYSDEDSGLLYRYECRDSKLPLNSAAAGDAGEANIIDNLSLAQSNPIPDGRSRKRTLKLLDGALINNSRMIILFEEKMSSFLDPSDTDGISAYGYLVLEKVATDLDDTDTDNDGTEDVYEGESVSDTRTERNDLLDVSCSDAVLYDSGILDINETLSRSTAPRVISALITGVTDESTPVALTTTSAEQVHYYCEDTGLFDGGPDNSTKHGTAMVSTNSCGTSSNTTYYNNNGACEDGGPNSVSQEKATCSIGTDLTDCGTRYTDDKDVRIMCPVGSKVTFFTLYESEWTQAEIADLDCQEDGTCLDVLEDWKAAGTVVNVDPHFACETGGYYCDVNRLDLRDGKTFYAVTEQTAVLSPFRSALEQAFRYRVQFRSRSGSQVGFAPEICIENSNQIPYCYAPTEIESLRERVDCLLHIWDEYELDLVDDGEDVAVDQLDDFLSFNFAYEDDCIGGDPNRCSSYDGFERLNAELLIMMGDESYTKAFSSRFDLAATNTKSFEGELFEDDGINLSGVAGNEMYNLYQAVQYYSEALDRFYSLSPLVWQAVEEDIAESAAPQLDHRASFVTPEMVTTYMERLLRASTQKARAYSQIADKYQAFNEAELARTVIERAYTATYLESVALSQVMQKIRDSFSPSDRPQIEKVLEDGQRRYRMALLDMRNVYNSITDETTIFGLDPDYIPFPTLNDTINQDNAFQKLLARAWQRLDLAKARENIALESDRSFDTDSALFQSELTQIRTTYESQLGDVCGTFTAEVNGQERVFPAIRRYAHLDPTLAVLGDPCGMVGNGSLYNAMVQVDITANDLQTQILRSNNVQAQIETEKTRVAEQCELIDGIAAFVLCAETGEDCSDVPSDANVPGYTSIRTLETSQRVARSVKDAAQRAFDTAKTLAELTKCGFIAGAANGGDCTMVPLVTTMFTVAAVANESSQVLLQAGIEYAESEINYMRDKIGNWQTKQQCKQLSIDSAARVKDYMLQSAENNLEMQRTQYQIQLALADIQRLHNQATRLQLEQEEAEDMAINVQAAKNDPNVRIYKNDAILNADIAFEDALKQAYMATRVLEYYTSQSYEDREKLYLVRMISSGDYNLENYLVQLENSFLEFEEEYGEADQRVEMLSLMNDIFKVPLVDETGRNYTNGERVTMLHERLADTSLLDENGYIVIPFSTSVDDLSPRTRNHKISYIEIDWGASEIGDDDIGRLYLRQKGTSVVSSVTDEKLFFRFPEREAVCDVYFGGSKVSEFLGDIYKNYRFRDRPFANTAWELVINMRDEPANLDVNLMSTSDIKIYIWYTDYSVF